ncbi:Dormancy-associated protein homolog 3 [Linum perenne]
MGFLDQLWDDTVAGPTPENGLGKLRKHKTFSFRSNSVVNVNSNSSEEPTRVTRSITIVRPPGYQQSESPLASPAGSTPPVSPFSGKAIHCLLRSPIW